MKVTYLAITFACLGLVSCATPTVVATQEVSDVNLSCEQLVAEIAEAERFRQAAQNEKGATGTNVAAGIFFWPALFATYRNIDEATHAAEERKRYLVDLYNSNDCSTGSYGFLRNSTYFA